MNGLTLALLPLAGAFLGTLLQSWLTRNAERKKQIELLRSEAYADYIKAVAARGHLRTDEDYVASSRALADAKARIAVYGSDAVVRALAKLDESGAVLTSETSATEFVNLVSAMRPGNSRALYNEIRVALLGTTKAQHEADRTTRAHDNEKQRAVS